MTVTRCAQCVRRGHFAQHLITHPSLALAEPTRLVPALPLVRFVPLATHALEVSSQSALQELLQPTKEAQAARLVQKAPRVQTQLPTRLLALGMSTVPRDPISASCARLDLSATLTETSLRLVMPDFTQWLAILTAQAALRCTSVLTKTSCPLNASLTRRFRLTSQTAILPLA